MRGFTVHRGICVPIREDNVDTDQIIPSREMKAISKQGLGDGLFAGWRYRYDDAKRVGLNDEFVLNQPAYRNASILLGGKNFGCGSSREHAVWALRDFGIRVLIAESYGRIFFNNCARNRLLAICLAADDLDKIERATAEDPQSAMAAVDLRRQVIDLPNGDSLHFDVAASDRSMLLAGADYIDFTLRYRSDIDDYLERDRVNRPWAHL